MVFASLLGLAFANNDLRHADSIKLENSNFVRIEGRVNIDVFGRQSEPALATGPAGKFVIAWDSQRTKRGLPGVFSRSFDGLGRPLSGQTDLTGESQSAHLRPSVALKSSGGEVSTNESRYRNNRVLAAFARDKQLSKSIGQSHDAVCASGPDGLWIATWVEEVGQDANRTFAQVFDKNDKPVTEPVRVSSFRSGNDSSPTLATSPDGIVVAWQRFDASGQPAGLVAQRVSWTGALTGNNVKVAGPSALEPSIAPTSGGFAVAWSENTGVGSVVRFRTLGRDLQPTSGSIAVAAKSARQNGAAVAADSQGKILVAWNSYGSKDCDIYAQVFEESGKPSSPAFAVTRERSGDQTLPVSGKTRIAIDGSSMTFAWSGQGKIGDSTGVYFTRIVPQDSSSQELLSTHNMEFTKLNAATDKVVVRLDKVGRVDTAGPHQPPVSDFKKVVNPWGYQFPMANGGFVGHVQTSFTPPDMNIAIGSGNVVVTVNDGISIFNKLGSRSYTNNMRQTNGFWGNLAAPDNFIYDPECFYDRITNRYWVMATQGAGSGTDSAALVAVSDDGDPNGVWFTYRFLATSLAGNFFDSPNFGVDNNALYVTGDGFGLGSNYPVFCFEKAPMLSGGNPSIIRSAAMPTSTQSAGISPVQESGSAYYMVEHKEAGSNTGIDLIALTNPLTTGPNFTRFTLTVPSYNAPEQAPQGGSTSRVNCFDARMWSVKFRNGYIWASHHVNSTRVRARWYQIDPRGWPTSGNNPTIVQSGEVDLGGTLRTFFPAIDADAQDNMALAYARSSTTEFYSAAHSFRRFGDATGTTQGHTIDQTSTGAYTSGRWGDYSGCNADPVYPGLFWGCAEFATGTSWNAWVQPFYATNELWATGLTTTNGVLKQGGLSDTLKEGDSQMVHESFIRANANDPFIGYELTSRTFRTGQTTASVRYVYRVDAPGFTLRLQGFDFVNNAWVDLHVGTAAVTMTGLNVNVPNPTNFVRTTDGQIRFRARIEPSGGPQGAATIRLFTDRWAWIEN